MTKTQFYIGLFILIFIFIFLIDYIINRSHYSKRKKNKKSKNKDIMEISYLVEKFNLDKKKLPINKLLLLIAFFNALIISITSLTVILCNTFLILQLVIGFVLLLGLIYAIYEITGRILVKRGYSKNGK